MRWANTLLRTLTHTGVRFQTDCISLSTEKSYWKNRGLIWPVTFTPSISHLLYNIRIFFMGEAFPFIGSKCENQQLLPYNWEQKCLPATQPSLLCPMLLHQHQTCCQHNWLQGVGSAPGRILSSPFLPCLPTPSYTKHSTESTTHAGTAEVKSPDNFFSQQFGPA